MFKPSRHRTCLVALVAAGIAGSAQARDVAPQTPAPRTRLAVVETGQEFSIQTSPTGVPRAGQAGSAAGDRLALGLNLTLDRSLFAAAAKKPMEASDAQRR
jgi:hypothetical protein